MHISSRNRGCLLVLALVLNSAPAWAQRWRKPPQIGYAFPSGGRQGQSLQVTVGGQRFKEEAQIFVSGKGVQAKLVEYLPPLRQKDINKIRQAMRAAQKRFREQNGKKKEKVALRSREGRMLLRKLMAEEAKKKEVTLQDIERFREWRKRRNDPKRQLNPQLAETMTVEIQIDADAAPGVRTLRVMTNAGLSNPIRFLVGQLPQMDEIEPNSQPDQATKIDNLPIVANGQIMPGDVDHFRFTGKKGSRIVIDVDARKIVPYLADAVPGWFQATVALLDSEGNELAFVDDFRHDPDPILAYRIPADGEYIVQIRDSIYRGREDFVYRIRIGELPQITGLYPLGVQAGKQTAVELTGYNLPPNQQNQRLRPSSPGRVPVQVQAGKVVSEPWYVRAVDTQVLEATEPNDAAADALEVKGSAAINGRIETEGDIDVFAIQARKGQTLIARVEARTLNSPLDSLLWITDAKGKELSRNDDYEDPGHGLITHHADARLEFQAPADGKYLLWIGDTQHRGGEAFAYLLHVGSSAGDFDLRITPSAVNARAAQAVPIEVFALRKGGFDGPIHLELVDAPQEYSLSGATIPAGADKVRLTLHLPARMKEDAVQTLQMAGKAKIDGREVERLAEPADDQMQAFIYHHLVCVDQWTFNISKRRYGGPTWTPKTELPLKLQPGQRIEYVLQADRIPPNGKFQIRLDNPPEGISLAGVKIEGNTVTLGIRAAKDLEPSAGNLMMEASTVRTFNPGKPNQRVRTIPVGYLPATPYILEK
jgi:hypothetical protein